MDTALLKTFLVLAKTQSFTQTAERLFRSQSAISLQMTKLEESLGTPLFIRNNRNVVLTPRGEQLLGYAKAVLKAEEDLLAQCHRLTKLTGEIRFGTPEDLATSYLPGILAKFKKTNPDVVLNVNCEFTLDLIEGFEMKKYDLILIKQNPSHADSRSQEVWMEPLVWVCNQDFPKDAMEKNDSIPLVLAPQPCVYRQRAIDALNQEGRLWHTVYTSPSLTGKIAAVKAGLGYSVLPLNMVSKELCICRDLPKLQKAQVALLQQENPSEAVRVFSHYIISTLASIV